MERTLIMLTGSSQAALVDQDIAHIGRVMRPSLQGDLAGPILPVTYWRKRLYQLLDTGNLSHAQLCAVDSLLLQLDQFEAEPPPVWTGPTAAPFQPVHVAASRHL
ncbi:MULTISPECIES: hypothetical protein [Paraburkholderia]|jgi:hypothetical protein|uniref:Uncharacterized protein n=1 Tax=Paraburkholderia aspalathi TaxID=1324617 RepID=A0A1I7ELE5_9BURK|nr:MULTISPECIES: hypothetical protein [Paraburkholderia]MCP2087176.1 hypothetical protein [Paraburkholderia sediminicola]MBK3843803.1 hypothetical protein [Paraburkholderia aspalathi]MCX4139397.1 hypothetical protein [Paraburkholderia aspalathi]MCX4156184.1 hypothetical protein [Paraburkholderia aspalathi]MDN7165590.1 hypothetical protein [Paraburkholderia sp. SECH2]